MPAPAPDPAAAQVLAPTTEALPVAVVGAGPVGLAAAAHLLRRGEAPLVLEAGDGPGAAVRAWGHVRLFSPWRALVDAAAAALLAEAGWEAPDPDRLPTGRELVERYLEPLAALPALRDRIRYGARVVSVARRGYDKLKTEGRDGAPFVLRVRTPDGAEAEVLARAVIDASGTYASPNPLGAERPARRRRAGAGRPHLLRHPGRPRRPPRPLRRAPGGRGGQRPLRLQRPARPGRPRRGGAGHGGSPGSSGAPPGDACSAARSGTSCPPAASWAGASGAWSAAAASASSPCASAPCAPRRTGIVVQGRTPPARPRPCRPSTSWWPPPASGPTSAPLRELRLALDPALEAPAALAPLIDPNVHSCGTVPPHGAPVLAHPEPGFYVVGMKSYGRAPTFLLLTGYEQVRSVAAALTGDEAGARSVELVLPETGVCSAAGPAGGGCGDDEDDDDGADGAGAARPEPALVAAGAACCG